MDNDLPRSRRSTIRTGMQVQQGPWLRRVIAVTGGARSVKLLFGKCKLNVAGEATFGQTRAARGMDGKT